MPSSPPQPFPPAEPSEGLKISREGGRCVIEWDNARQPKNGCLLWVFNLWLVIWVGGISSVTWAMFRQGNHGWGSIAGLVAAGSFYLYLKTIAARRLRERIELSEAGVKFSSEGFMAWRPQHFALDALAYIALGKHVAWHNGGGNPGETMMTLSVWSEKGGNFATRQRIIVGYWLPYDSLRYIFDTLREHGREHLPKVRFVLHDASHRVIWQPDGTLKGDA